VNYHQWNNYKRKFYRCDNNTNVRMLQKGGGIV